VSGVSLRRCAASLAESIAESSANVWKLKSAHRDLVDLDLLLLLLLRLHLLLLLLLFVLLLLSGMGLAIVGDAVDVADGSKSEFADNHALTYAQNAADRQTDQKCTACDGLHN